MANRTRSPMTNDFYNIIGVTTTTSIKEICKVYKSLMKWTPDKHHDKSTEPYKANNGFDQYEPLTISEPTTIGFDHRKSIDDNFFPRPNPILSRETSQRSKTPTPKSSLSRNSSQRSGSNSDQDSDHSSRGGRRSRHMSSSETHIHTSTASSRNVTNPIIFSQSTASTKKPPSVQRKLECTLEDLLEGCTKKIKITRDVIADIGIIIPKEEVLWIDVKPGWRTGTKITLEGKGDQKPGYLPADIILSIDEIRHPLYEREGDDLVLVVEIPLVNALTGCSIPIPLLGGEKMTLSFDDIIFPGYQKVIRGQGMPKAREEARRGDLKIKFLIEFPLELGAEQRAEACGILQDCSF